MAHLISDRTWKAQSFFTLLLLIVSLIFDHCFDGVDGHAIFWEPPSRASLGKHNMNFCKVPVNNNHMSLWCGGIKAQHQDFGGKCGICGDPYEGYQPHQVPGKYATGIIGRSYFEPGQVINVTIDLAANHLGFFGFRLCPNNNINVDPEGTCFENHPLKFEDGSKFHYVPNHQGHGHSHVQPKRIPMRLKLPDGITCWQCILQWTYVTGNSWGAGPQMADMWTDDCLTTSGKKGCGDQETFRGCADICIGAGCPREPCTKAKPFGNNPLPIVTTTTTTTEKPTTIIKPTTISTSITPSTTITHSSATSITTTTIVSTPISTTTALPPTTTSSIISSTTTNVVTITPTTTPTTTMSTPTLPTPDPNQVTSPCDDWTVLPPIQDQICLQAGIKKPFYSILGNHYCQHTCLFKPMDVCNLYLCYCNTECISSRNF